MEASICIALHLYWFSSQHEESLSSLGKESSELVHQDMLDLVRLLDLDTDPYAINAWFDKDTFVLVACDGQRVQDHLRRGFGFDLGDIVPFRGLRGEIGQR